MPIIGFGLLLVDSYRRKIRDTQELKEAKCQSTDWEISMKRLPRKSSKNMLYGTVPQTDTGDLVEKT